MKVKNNSIYPKIVSGTRIEPGDTADVDVESVQDLGNRIEVVEKSGDSSDQNTKDEEEKSENSDNGGE